MKRYRVSIAGIMIVVAFVAVDLSAILYLRKQDFGSLALSIIGALPMVNLLVLHLLMYVRVPRDDSHREAWDYLVGCQTLGWTAVSCYLALTYVFPSTATAHFLWILNRVRSVFDTFPGTSFDRSQREMLTFLIVTSYYTLPQEVLAMTGGSIHRHDERRIRARLATERELPAAR